MISYSNKIYVGDSIKEKKIPSLKFKIKQGRGFLKLYLIVLSNNNSDQLDIIHNSMLKQRLYRKLDLRIVGFANSYEEATKIVLRILDETMEATGTCDIKKYLEDFFA